MDSDAFGFRIERSIRQIVAGAKVLGRRQLSGGISATTLAVDVRVPDGSTQTFVIRQPTPEYSSYGRNAAKEEFRLWSALEGRGLPVQAAYLVEDDDSEIDRPFLVLEYIDGAPELRPTDTVGYVHTLADQLAAIHRTDRTGLEFMPMQGDTFVPRGTMSAAFREPEVVAMMQAIGRPESNPAVLRHGDFWPGNILWKHGAITGVIDWEEALIGDPLADLGILRLDISFILGADAANILTDRYFEQSGFDRSGLTYWDLAASLRPMPYVAEWAAAYPGIGHPDVTEATMSRDLRAFVDHALKS